MEGQESKRSFPQSGSQHSIDAFTAFSLPQSVLGLTEMAGAVFPVDFDIAVECHDKLPKAKVN